METPERTAHRRSPRSLRPYSAAAGPQYGTDHQEDAQAPLGGTLEHLDPTSLVLGENVREYPNLNKPFLDSIAERGVVVPLTAIRHATVRWRSATGSAAPWPRASSV